MTAPHSLSLSQVDLRQKDRFAASVCSIDFDGDPTARKNCWAHRAVGVVLAGGQARRMGGQDKPRLKVGGKTMICHVAERLAPQVATIVISAHDTAERFVDLPSPVSDLAVVQDTIEDHAGPLAGILAAMRWAQENAPHAFWIVSTAADTPFFPDNLTDRLVLAMSGPEPAIVLAQSGDRAHPVFGLWPIALADDLEAYLKDGQRKVRGWAETHLNSRAIFPGLMLDEIEIDPFFNVNEPDDLEVANAIADALSERTTNEAEQ